MGDGVNGASSFGFLLDSSITGRTICPPIVSILFIAKLFKFEALERERGEPIAMVSYV